MTATATAVSLRDRVEDLIEHIRTGRIIDAMNEFYAGGVVMTEPAYGATVGLPANLKREEAFLAGVGEWKGFNAPKIAVRETGPGTGVAFIENDMDFVTVDGQAVHVEQVSVQEWRDGKIVHERFYYDRGA